ncbi:transposase [Streptomyces maremycinicus]|uniref:transposase n=1 Tax=Streptomyces maremycinicus TaxID=1679753 RepID=UPI0035B53F94
MTEQGQKPLSLLITAGHRHDSPQFQPVLERIRVPRTGPGRPRTKPSRVRADKAYGSRANRSYLRRRRIGCTIPEKADQVRNRRKLGSRGGRPPAARSCGGGGGTTRSALRGSQFGQSSARTMSAGWPSASAMQIWGSSLG